MNILEKMPFILAALITIIIGIVSYLNRTDMINIYLRLLVSFVIFYVLGIYIRHSIKSLLDEVEKQKNEKAVKDAFNQKEGKK